MGALRFVATAATYGILLTVEEAKEKVWAWRELNPKIKGLWYEYDRVARLVINQHVVESQWAGKASFRMGKDTGRFANCLIIPKALRADS